MQNFTRVHFRKKIPNQKMNNVCESILSLVEKDTPNHFKKISKTVSEKRKTLRKLMFYQRLNG